MFDRLQKPFLTIETGEAYQPLRLTYDLFDKEALVETLNHLQCLQKNPSGNSWSWYWKDEAENLHFESIDSFRKNTLHPVRLGTLLVNGNQFYINVPSFKRACLALTFFYPHIPQAIARAHHADFINKVFALDERLPRGLTEVFNDTELNHILEQRAQQYAAVQAQCEQAETAEEATAILDAYLIAEGKKRLPYAERYVFKWQQEGQPVDPEVIFLSFYIFLRGRESVAVNRWFGQINYSLTDMVDELMQQVFGNMDIDIIE